MQKKSATNPSKSDIAASADVTKLEASARAHVKMELDFCYDDGDDDAPDSGGAEDAARYIADMIGSLALLAREAKLDLLAYLLDMAHVEAEMQSRQSETPFEED
jgi:hypothetical protein